MDARKMVATLIRKDQDRLEPCLGGAGFWLSSGLPARDALHRALERDEALVEQWLNKEYPQIKALAQKEKAEIYFGDDR